MADLDREEVVWYYELGGRALGPVSWTEIEELLEDAFEAKNLLVARGGDDHWRSAQDVIDELEEAEPEAGEKSAEEAEEEPEKEPREPLTPVHGLKPWIVQAWEIIKDDAREYFTDSILLVALSSVSLMLCFPALHAGLYLIALKRFDGENLESGDFIGGFQFFGRALGLYAVIFLIGLPGGILVTVGSVMLIVALPEDSAVRNILMLSPWLFWLATSLVMALPGAAAFFAMPLIIDRDMGVMEALKASWAVTRRNYLSYLGMMLVLSLLSGLGGLLCWIGVVFTLPILPVAQVCAYRYYFRGAA